MLAGPTSADQARSALGMLAVCSAGSVSSTPTCWWTAAGSTRARRPSGCWSGPTGWCWWSGRVWPTCTRWPAWLEGHPTEGAALGLVMVGEAPIPTHEIADALGIEVLARLPWDPDGGGALVSVPASARELGWRRWCVRPGRWPTVSPPN